MKCHCPRKVVNGSSLESHSLHHGVYEWKVFCQYVVVSPSLFGAPVLVNLTCTRLFSGISCVLFFVIVGFCMHGYKGLNVSPHKYGPHTPHVYMYICLLFYNGIFKGFYAVGLWQYVQRLQCVGLVNKNFIGVIVWDQSQGRCLAHAPAIARPQPVRTHPLQGTPIVPTHHLKMISTAINIPA